MENSASKNILIGIVAVIIGVVALYTAWTISSKTPESQKVNIEIKKDDNKKGNKNAKIILVEYSDFQCPACKNIFGVLEEIIEKNKEDILFVYRHFPLSSHNNSKVAAQAAEAAGSQGKFWEMHKTLFENQDEWAKSSKPESLFIKYAKDLKIDEKLFIRNFNSQKIKNKIESQIKLANTYGVGATPTFFLSGKRLDGYRTLGEFEGIIDQAIKESKK